MLEEAEKYGLEALRLAKEQQMIPGPSHLLSHTIHTYASALGDIYEAMGRMDEAWRYDEMACETICAGIPPHLLAQSDFMETQRRSALRYIHEGKLSSCSFLFAFLLLSHKIAHTLVLIPPPLLAGDPKLAEGPLELCLASYLESLQDGINLGT